MMTRSANTIFKLGSRASPLALVQAEMIAAAVKRSAPPERAAGLEVVICPIRTRGDRLSKTLLWQQGGKELFVSALEDALLAGRIDAAVHALKDMPQRQPDGLVIGCIPERGDARDCLVTRWPEIADFAALPPGARFGSASPRRRAQALHRRPDLALAVLRGNVDTRLAKIEAGELDATLLAAAGLARLNLARGRVLPPDEILPAAGQGALALERRQDDALAASLLAPLHHRPSALACAAERAFTSSFGANCRVPAAAYAQVEKEGIFLRAALIAPDGGALYQDEGRGREPQQLGEQVAARVKKQVPAALLASLAQWDD